MEIRREKIGPHRPGSPFKLSRGDRKLHGSID